MRSITRSLEPANVSRFRARAQESGNRRAELEAALTEARGNMVKAAERLGIHRSTLYAELLRHGLDSAAFRKR
jgi:transcriptional regulator of acetoin/glycerol metabolism